MNGLTLLPIGETLNENGAFLSNPVCAESLAMTVDYYKIIGFVPPWISYFAEMNGKLVGTTAFKGKPVNGQIEIAYWTFEPNEGQGIGTQMCANLLKLARESDPDVRITARTLPETGASTKILEKNGFVFTGTVNDPDDGDVWEWVYTA